MFPRRQFTASEDALLAAVAGGAVSLEESVRRIGCHRNACRRRMAELGLSLPQRFKSIAKMGRPRKQAGVLQRYGEEPLEGGPPISVGADKYLARLKAVHVFPRDEVYPGSGGTKTRHLRRVA